MTLAQPEPEPEPERRAPSGAPVVAYPPERVKIPNCFSCNSPGCNHEGKSHVSYRYHDQRGIHIYCLQCGKPCGTAGSGIT